MRLLSLVAFVALGGCSIATGPLAGLPRDCREDIVVGALALTTPSHEPEVREPFEAVAFLARWVESLDPDDAFVTDGAATLSIDGVEASLVHQGGGAYEADPQPPQADAVVTLEVRSAHGGGTLEGLVPRAPRPEWPTRVDAGRSVTVSLARTWPLLRGDVIDDDGELVWRSVDRNIWGNQEWLRAPVDAADFTFPAEAFPSPDATYNVALSGLETASLATGDLDLDCDVLALGSAAIGTLRTNP